MKAGLVVPVLSCFVQLSNLYCFHDLVFLPEINHCQEERGLQNTQGQKSLSSS